MIAPAPGVFGYARVPDVDYPVGLYVVAEHKGDEAEPKKWLIARTALESDGDGEGYSAFSRRGREEILWYEWVELAELDPAPPARGTKYVAIDCVNVGDGLDLSSLRAACPDELLRPHEAWASKDDFIGGSPRPATRAVEHHIGGSPVIGGADSGPQRQQQTDVAAIVRQLEHGMKVAMTAAVGQIETKIDERFATVDARLAAVEGRAPMPSQPAASNSGASGLFFGSGAAPADRSAAEAAARRQVEAMSGGASAGFVPQSRVGMRRPVNTGVVENARAEQSTTEKVLTEALSGMTELVERLAVSDLNLGEGTTTTGRLSTAGIEKTERAARANPDATANAWEERVRRSLMLKKHMPFSPHQLAEKYEAEFAKHRTLQRWWLTTTQLWEECNDDDHTAEQKLALVRMLLTQHFKMLEQATISGGAFGAAWPHSFLPPIEGGQAVGASAADRAAVATDVTNRARLAEALKKAEK